MLLKLLTAINLTILVIVSINAYKEREVNIKIESPVEKDIIRGLIGSIVKTEQTNGLFRSSGSAIIISPSMAVTASHVCEGTTEMMLFGAAIKPTKAKKLKYSMKQGDPDVCLIEADFGQEAPIISINNRKGTQLGKPVFMAGFPDEKFKITKAEIESYGFITVMADAAGRTNTSFGYTMDRDCLPGHSGGALVNTELELIGITVAHIASEEKCLVVPVHYVRAFLADTNVKWRQLNVGN